MCALSEVRLKPRMIFCEFFQGIVQTFYWLCLHFFNGVAKLCIVMAATRISDHLVLEHNDKIP